MKKYEGSWAVRIWETGIQRTETMIIPLVLIFELIVILLELSK